MDFKRLTALGAFALFATTGLGSACREEPAPPPEKAICTDAAPAMVALDASSVAVHLEGSGAHLAPVRADLERYLGAMWGTLVTVREGAPEAGAPAVWISSSPAAREQVGGEPANGYAFKRIGDGAESRWIVAASDEENLAFAAYAFLERLGARFFHPRQEHVPSLGGVKLPADFEAVRSPAFATRGIQLHTLHPIEYLDSFNEPGEQSLAEAKQFIDWLVKTGQNHVQWWPMESMDLAAWKAHAREIVAYAHARKVKAGVVGHLWGGASLQRAVALVTQKADWQAEMERNIEALLEVPFDLIELGLGEFLAEDPASTIAWLDHATAHVAAKHPGVDVSVVNHVGNYENLFLEHDGRTVYFYHLPQYADSRLINNVHTLYLYDLYRRGGMYKHEDFFGQREYLFAELPKRRVRYMPESAYWCSADIDVPAFLPEYVHARWLDIHNLHRDAKAKGLPPVDGHIMFSSGHEWGYWLTDYLSAKAMWEPEQELGHFLAHFGGAFGACRSDVTRLLSDYVALQTEYMFDKNLVAYVSGEDMNVDLGTQAGFQTQPPRPPFIDVLRMSAPERAAFEAGPLADLEAMDRKSIALLDELRPVCAAASEELRSWCAELEDGIEIVALRMRHTALLYRAILASAKRSDEAAQHIAMSDEVVEAARAAVERRARSYRFPVERLTGAYENPTIYPFGYLNQAHTLCLWTRRTLEAKEVMSTREPPNWLSLPTCLE